MPWPRVGRYGYRKIRALLNRDGWNVGKYWWSASGAEEVKIPKKQKPRKRSGSMADHVVRLSSDWAEPSVVDGFCERTMTQPMAERFRLLTVVDVYTRECLAIQIGAEIEGRAMR